MTESDVERSPSAHDRRAFLKAAPSVAMAGGLVAGYGTLAVMAGRFLYPARPQTTSWQLVCTVESVRPGGVFTYRTPAGAPVTITRRPDDGEFVALSSTCPHLGCRVHWEPHNERFLCPCHNGTFDPEGRPTGGPPADAGQALPRYALKVEGGMLFIEVADTTTSVQRQDRDEGVC